MHLKSMICAAILMASAGGAHAADLTFVMDNEYIEDVGLEFYSMDRNHVWPGGDDVWVLGPSDGAVPYKLQCQPNELVCFGAWTISQKDQWGAGIDNSMQCETCCFYCDGTVTDIIELN